jgi:Tol biopolymer transport system component
MKCRKLTLATSSFPVITSVPIAGRTGWRDALLSIASALIVTLMFGACKPSEKAPSNSGDVTKSGQSSASPGTKGEAPSSATAQAQQSTSTLGPVTQTKLSPAPETQVEFVVSSNGLNCAWVERKGPTTDFGDRVWFDGTPGQWYELCNKLTLSQDGTHLSYRAIKRGATSSCVVLNGKELRPEEAILSLQFSPDGKHFAYVATQGDQTFAVVDGKEGPHFKNILNMDSTAVDSDLILFSPRCERHAYIASTADEKKVVVVDGKASPVYDTVSPRPMFYADGEHFVYVATSAQGKAFVVTDGQSGPQFDSVTAWDKGKTDNKVGFSPNGKRMYYLGIDGTSPSQRVSVVLDGKVVKEAQQDVQVSCFSPDNLRFIFSVERDTKRVVFVGEAEQPPVDAILSGDALSGDAIRFSPDGKRFAYVAAVGRNADRKFVVFVDGKPSEPYKGVDQWPIFSADGTSVAYVAVVEDNRSGSGEAFVVVQDGKKGPSLVGVLPLTFAPVGNRLAYIAQTNGATGFLVDNGHVGEEMPVWHPEEVLKVPFFSPDGKRLAYVKPVEQGNIPPLTMVVDGKECPANAHIRSGPFWSDDSRRFAYFASDLLFVDGKEYKQGSYEVVKAYFAPKSGKLLVLMSEKLPDGRVKSFVVFFEGQRGPVLDELVPPDANLFAPVFSADGNHVTYAGKRTDGYVVVRDDKEGPVVNDLLGPLVDNVITRRLHFAADGSVEYLAVKDGNLHRVVQR